MKIVISGEVHSSKNSRRIFKNHKTGNMFVAKSKASKADEKTFLAQLSGQREIWEKMTRDASYPLQIVFHFRRKTRAKFDYVNIAQGLLDAMQEAGYIVDDCADYVIPVFVQYVVSSKNPGCDIYVVSGSGAYYTPDEITK